MSKRNSRGELTKGSPENGPESLPDQEEEDRDKSDDDSSKKKKFFMGFGKPSEKGNDDASKKGIQIKLGMNQKILNSTNTVKAKSQAVAAVFNDDDDDEPEEMPPEARMRMRNIGRETPTSTGPNSFGKTKQGFCDSKRIFEKTMKKAMDTGGGGGGTPAGAGAGAATATATAAAAAAITTEAEKNAE